MPTPKMTEAEILSYLGRTSLPTLLVEGEDDAAIYRWLESQLGIFTGSILSCSGRDIIISIYNKLNTFKHGKIACLADLDMWVFSSPPADLSGIIFTTGYSIENDLYAGSDIENLLEPVERTQHAQLLDVVCRWFASELIEFQSGRPHLVAMHINRIIDYNIMDVSENFRASRNYKEPAVPIVTQIKDNYKLHLRGKTLLQAIIAFLQRSAKELRIRRFPIASLQLGQE